MSAEPYDFYLAAGDQSAAIERVLTDEDGNAEDLSTANAVTFVMWEPDGTEVINATATFPNGGGDGVARYSWQAGDTTDAGSYEGRFVVDRGGGVEESWPNHRKYQIYIDEDG